MRQFDEGVWADLCDLLPHPEMIRQAVELAHGGAWLPQELQARRENLRKASVGLFHQIDCSTEAYLEQIVSLGEYRRRRRELEGYQEAIYARMRLLEASMDRQMELTTVAQGIESFCQRVHQGLEQATFGEMRTSSRCSLIGWW